MKTFGNVTVSAAKEAVQLYFEPLRQLRRWFRPPDDCDDTTVRSAESASTLLVDEVRHEHLLEHGLPDLLDRQLLDVLRAQSVFLTAASHPYATQLGEWLLESSGELCLVDHERRRDDVMRNWKAILRRHTGERIKFIFGNLSDEAWLCRTLENEQPNVVFDFTTHIYLRAQGAMDANIGGQSRRFQYIYDKGETITNIVRCSVSLNSVNAVVLVMPRLADAEVLDHFSRLYANVLRDQTVVVGAHVAPQTPTISVWAPKQRALPLRYARPALAGVGGLDDEVN
ncbi:MAG: hypothetical protein ACXW5U_25440 [Thermoanaerobaculia bacterium]